MACEQQKTENVRILSLDEQQDAWVDERRREVAEQQPMDMYVYYKFRLTLDENTFESGTDTRKYLTQTKSWFSWLQETGFVDGKATAGCEIKGKTGEFCRPHMHVHFRSMHKKDAIAQAMRRKYFKEEEIKLKGNQMYALKLDPYPDNDIKFFGYALKQQNPNKDLLTVGFSQTQAWEMCVAGNAQYKSTCEYNAVKQMHREEKETLYDRLEEFLDKEGATLENILKFYIEKNKPINDTTIVGYFHLYRLKKQIITFAEYSDKLKSKYNI